MKRIVRISRVLLLLFLWSCAGFDTIDDIEDFTIADINVLTSINFGEGTAEDPFQINVGSSYTISVIDTRDPNGERVLNNFLNWEVNNSEILEVVDGTITTKSAGMAEVRAIKSLGNGRDQEFGHWFISTFQFQRLEVLTGTTLNVVHGDSVQLMTNYFNAENAVQNDVEIEFISGDESILGVRSNGYVAGLQPGETTLTLRVLNIAEDIQTQLQVMVEEDSDRPFSIRVENLSTNIQLGDSVLLMGKAYSFSGMEIADVNFVWESSDTDIVDITPDGYAKGLKLGSSNVTASLEDGTLTSDPVSFDVIDLFDSRMGSVVSGRGGTTGTVELFISRQDTLLYVKLNDDFFGANIPGPTLYLSNAETTVEGGLRVSDVDPGDGEGRTFLIPGNPDIKDFNYVIYHCEPFNIIYGSFKLEEE